MGRGSISAIPKAWDCLAFRSALRISAEHARFARSPDTERTCPWNCPSAWATRATMSRRAGAHASVKQIRILLADDHTVMRRGLRLLLESRPEFGVVAEASDGRQAVERAEATQPDVAILDIAMPNLSGIEAAQRINAALPHLAIVILSMHSDEGYVL